MFFLSRTAAVLGHFLPLYVLIQLPRPFPGWCDLLWPSCAKTAVLFSPQLAAAKLPIQCCTSTPDEERAVLLWTACAHTRRQDWITDCFVGDRETLWGKVSREKECRAASPPRSETQPLRQKDWDTLCKKKIFAVYGEDLMEAWESKRRRVGRMSERSGRLHGLLMSCVCEGAAWGLKGPAADDGIHNYYWYRPRLGADSSPYRRRHTGFTVLDQMRTVTWLDRGNRLFI